MKLYYIEDTMFLSNPMQDKVRERFLSLLQKEQTKIIFISSCHKHTEYLQEFIENYHNVLVSPAIFEIDGIRGQLHSTFLSIEGFPSMQPYSGSVVEYDEDTKTCRRIYLDMFLNHEIFEDTAFEIEDLKEFLEEEFQKIKKKYKVH